MSEVKVKERDKSIDIAKGIGIILVVYAHLVCPIKQEIYLFHMPLFFLLSGYFFSAKNTVKNFLLKKTRSLLLPFLLFYILSNIYIYILENNHISLKSYIYEMPYFLSPNGSLWFLLSLFEIFVIHFLVEKYIHSRVLKFVIACVITFAGYLCAMNKIFCFYLPQACLGYIFFYLGSQMRQYNILHIRIISYVVIGSIISYCLGIILKVHTDISPLVIDRTYILFFLPALGGSLLTIYFSKILATKRHTNWLAYLGKNSLLIMCIHMPLISLSHQIVLPGLKIVYHLMGNTTATDAEMIGGRICGILSLIILVPMSLYIGLLIKKLFPSCFSN